MAPRGQPRPSRQPGPGRGGPPRHGSAPSVEHGPPSRLDDLAARLRRWGLPDGAAALARPLPDRRVWLWRGVAFARIDEALRASGHTEPLRPLRPLRLPTHLAGDEARRQLRRYLSQSGVPEPQLRDWRTRVERDRWEVEGLQFASTDLLVEHLVQEHMRVAVLYLMQRVRRTAGELRTAGPLAAEACDTLLGSLVMLEDRMQPPPPEPIAESPEPQPRPRPRRRVRARPPSRLGDAWQATDLPDPREMTEAEVTRPEGTLVRIADEGREARR